MLRGTLERVPRTPQNFSRILYWRGWGGGAERGLAPGGGRAPARHWLDLPLWCPVGGRSDFGRLLTLPLWCPAGGVPSLLPAYPAFSLFSCPHPPVPLPGGKGENFSFLMQGASPLAFPRLNPRGAGEWGRITRPAGGVPLRGTCYPCPRGRGPSQTPKFLSPGPPSPWLPALFTVDKQKPLVVQVPPLAQAWGCKGRSPLHENNLNPPLPRRGRGLGG